MEENQSLTPQSSHFPTKSREFRLLIAIAIIALLMINSVLYGGFNVGFAVMTIACIIVSFFYLKSSGRRPGRYASALTILGLIIAASFVRSDDGFVKFIMVCFLLVSGNLSMSLIAGQNRRSPNGITSVLDAPRAMFMLGLGQLGNAFGGINDARKNMGAMGRKNLAVLTGLAVAVPILAIMIPLLMRADAAFEGLIDLLPQMDVTQIVVTLIIGIPLAIILYTRNTALVHSPKPKKSTWTPRRFHPLTITTALAMVCFVYCVYLLSQLAYFVGGFSGILPEGFTMAEYARRGLFEMAWLSAINLCLMTLAVALSEQIEGRAPLSVRILCLFIGIVTLFFTIAASAKMLLYIDSYGLTRLRILTEVIMVFIALTVVFVIVWLFKPKFAYMKAVLLTALLMGACVAWTDVDTVVAAYNVSAYQSGKLETVDINHLCSLGDGAVPYIRQLADDPNEAIASRAERNLQFRSNDRTGDLRALNIASAIAQQYLVEYAEASDISQ